MTPWQHRRSRDMARYMVVLEQAARRLQRKGELVEARELWARRESVQWQRSMFLRDIWVQEQAQRKVPAA